jgi:thiamine biosynthesis lipoprotein
MAVIVDQFRAMGCAVEVVIVDGTDDLRYLAREYIEELEARWSRFRDDSDINKINNAHGEPVKVSPLTISLIRAMIDGWRLTEGAFDPTLLAPLVNLGYATSWENKSDVTTLAADAHNKASLLDIVIDDEALTVTAPAGTCIDAGGIGKGLAADFVTEAVVNAGARGAMVNIGGDLRVLGQPPEGDNWVVGVADHLDTAVERTQLLISSGGVATSGSTYRSWTTPDGKRAHHIVDPETLTSTDTTDQHSVVLATVIGGTAAWSEVWTKALFVAPVTTTLARLDELGFASRVVLADASEQFNDVWRSYDHQIRSADSSTMDAQ